MAPYPIKVRSPNPAFEPDISTWEKTGHFYLALTAVRDAVRDGVKAK